MSRHNQRGHKGRNRPNQSPRQTLYLRATAVVASPAGILLVKHNRQDDWSLPGGRVVAAEDPSRRAVLEVAEETGIIIADPVHMGRYAGTVASHEIFLANGDGTPRPNRRELRDAKWWDPRVPMDVQQHVSAILAIVRVGLQQQGTAEELPISRSDRLALAESLEQMDSR